MSQLADHQSTLRSMLNKYKLHPGIVIDVFYDTVTNQNWDGNSIVSMLKAGLGINNEIDALLQEYIDDTIKTYN